jgi:hypothetical protein
MLVYFWFFFIWLGAILAETQQQEHLSFQERQMTQWAG